MQINRNPAEMAENHLWISPGAREEVLGGESGGSEWMVGDVSTRQERYRLTCFMSTCYPAHRLPRNARKDNLIVFL